jgi:glycerol-3-phosphate O-acyltransferase / dihydroxyacetone phosphate acyltransferase
MPGQQQYLERLKAMRQSLSNELMDVINEFGPKLYDDFDKACEFLIVQGHVLTVISSQNRVLFPSSSVPMSSGRPGLWQRNSGAAAVETQDNLLAHPMVRT